MVRIRPVSDDLMTYQYTVSMPTFKMTDGKGPATTSNVRVSTGGATATGAAATGAGGGQTADLIFTAS